MINCNEIQQNINALLIAFADCKKIKNSDLIKLVQLIQALNDCDASGSLEQNNIDVIKHYQSYSEDIELENLVNQINTSPAFTINETQSLWINRYIFNSLLSPEPLLYTEIYKLIIKGKGNYGIGGTLITAQDLYLINTIDPSIQFLELNSSNQIYEIEDLLGLNISQYINQLLPNVTFQENSVGFRLIKVTESGNEANYLFLANGGEYGFDNLQTTIDDFQLLKVYNNNYFIKSNEDLRFAKRKENILYGILDQYTGEEITLSKTTDLNTADGIIYFNLGAEKFKRNFTELNPFWFGCKSDGITDDTINLRKFFDFAKDNNINTVFLPKGKSYYKVSNTIDLYVSINSDKAVVQFSNQTCFSVKRDSVWVDGLEITGTLTGTSSAPLGLASQNFSNIRINNCKIKDCRIWILNNSNVVMKDFYFTNNVVDCDLSGTEHLINQNDFLTVMGTDGIYIQNNSCRIINTHRSFKIQSSTFSLSSDYRSRNVFFTDNNIYSNSDSNKQVIDFFNNTSNILVDNNRFEVAGNISVVLENKTNNELTYDDSIKITNNLFKTPNAVIGLQGNYGSTVIPFVNGSKSCTITGNTFEVNYVSGVKETVGVRFYKNVNIANNTFTNEDKTFKSVKYINVSSNETSIISNNNLKNGYLFLNKLTTNSDASVFNAVVKSVIVDGNTFEDFGGYAGAVQCQAMTEGEIILSNNFASQLHVDGIANALIAVSNQVLTSIVATGNITSGNINVPIYLTGTTTVSKIVQSGNSWNQGTTGARPTFMPVNTPYYDTSLKKYIYFDGTNWVDGNSVVNATTTELSLATLNATYVNVLPGFEVHCMSIIIEGPTIYKKTATGWVTLRVIAVV